MKAEAEIPRCPACEFPLAQADGQDCPNCHAGLEALWFVRQLEPSAAAASGGSPWALRAVSAIALLVLVAAVMLAFTWRKQQAEMKSISSELQSAKTTMAEQAKSLAAAEASSRAQDESFQKYRQAHRHGDQEVRRLQRRLAAANAEIRRMKANAATPK